MFLAKKIKDDDRYKKIIIKYNDKINSGYSLTEYNKFPFLRSYISKEEFNNILDKANIIIYDSKIKKDKFDKVEINIWTYILIILSLVFTLIYIFLFYYIPRTENHYLGKKISGIVFFVAAIILLLGIEIFYSFKTIEEDKNLFYFYKDDLISYFEKVNNKLKNSIIFKFDEFNKNLICYVKIDPNDKINYNNIKDEKEFDEFSYESNKYLNKSNYKINKNEK